MVVDVAVVAVVVEVAVVVVDVSVMVVVVTVVDVHASHVTGHFATISENAHAETGRMAHPLSCGCP